MQIKCPHCSGSIFLHIFNELKDVLKFWRNDKKLTQKQAGELVELSQNEISQLETGRKKYPRNIHIKRLKQHRVIPKWIYLDDDLT
jgi:transcriptional regulator with XRE-family HTH domain